MAKKVKTLNGTVYSPVSSVRPIPRDRVKHASSVKYETPNDPSVLRMMKTGSVEEVLASRKSGNVLRNAQLPPSNSSFSRQNRRRRIGSGRRPLSPTNSTTSDFGPRSPLHSLYMNSVDNLQADRWMEEQQAMAATTNKERLNQLADTQRYEDDDVDEVEVLREQCELLALRLRNMEEQFVESSNLNGQMLQQRPSTTPTNFRPYGDEEVSIDERMRSDPTGFTDDLDAGQSEAPALSFTLKEIKGTLARLDGVFAEDDEDSELKMGNAAVTIISKAVRGWLVRIKYARLKTTLRRWRRRRTRPVRREFARVVRRRRVVDAGLELMIATRSMNMLRDNYEAWFVHTKELLPLRKVQWKGAMALALRIRHAYWHKIMKRWWTLANGQQSRKMIKMKNKIRKDQAHERILMARKQRKLPPTLITKDMVGEEMAMEATRLIQNNRKRVLMKDTFMSWAVTAVAPWRTKRKLADKHFLRKQGTHIFNNFRKFCKGRNELHGATKKKYTGRKRWEMKHNLRVIKQHHVNRMMRSHFVQWYQRAHQLQMVKRSFQGHVSHLIKTVIAAWRIEAKRRKEVKKLCVAEWHAYGIALWKTPFRTWYVYAKKRKESNRATQTLLTAWSRRKKRALINQIFKVWAHQARYGKTEGMHTRLELIKVVEDQKKVQAMMTKNLEKADDALKEMKSSLSQEKKTNSVLLRKFENAKSEQDKLGYASHNAEQEIVRLQSMLDSLALIHPGTIKQLKALDESRQFKDRGLEDFARVRGQIANTTSSQKMKSAPPAIERTDVDKGVSPPVAGKSIEVPELYAKVDPNVAASSIENSTNTRSPKKNIENVSDQVWVSPYDADIILRVQHVNAALEIGTKKEIGQAAPVVDKPKTKEEARLRCLLLYLTTGNEELLETAVDEAVLEDRVESVENTPEAEAAEVTPLRAHLGMLNRDKLSRSSKWADFLQDMAAMYPLRHRVNVDAHDRLAHRVAVAKKSREQKMLHGRPAFNILSVSEEQQLRNGNLT